MSEPWEDFQQGATVADAPSSDTPPWEDFKPAVLSDQAKADLVETAKKNAQRQAALGQPFAEVQPGGDVQQRAPDNNAEANRQEFASLPGRLSNAAEEVGAEILNYPAELWRADTGKPMQFVVKKDENGKDQLTTEEKPLPFQPGISKFENFQMANEDIDPVNSLMGKLVRGAGTPGMLLTLPAGEADLVKGYFLTQTVPGVVEGAQGALDTSKSTKERVESGLSGTVNGLFSYLLGLKAAKTPPEKLASELNATTPLQRETPEGAQPSPIVQKVNQNPWDDFKQPETPPAFVGEKLPAGMEIQPVETKPAESETKPPVSETGEPLTLQQIADNQKEQHNKTVAIIQKLRPGLDVQSGGPMGGIEMSPNGKVLRVGPELLQNVQEMYPGREEEIISRLLDEEDIHRNQFDELGEGFQKKLSDLWNDAPQEIKNLVKSIYSTDPGMEAHHWGAELLRMGQQAKNGDLTETVHPTRGDTAANGISKLKDWAENQTGDIGKVLGNKSPIESLGEGIDFATIQKPHLVGVEAGLKLTPEDVPALQALQKQSVGEMTAAAQTGDNAAFQTLMGKNSFIGGAIEGARRKGPNYDVYQSLKSSPPPESPIPAPAVPTAEPAAQTPVPAAGEVPSGFKAPPMPETFNSAEDVLKYRQAYKDAEIEFYKSLGLTDAEANKFFRAGDSRSSLDVSKIEEKLTPENQARLDSFSRGDGGAVYQWDRQYNPEELVDETSKSDLARSLVQNIARESAPADFGDKLLHGVIALRNLKANGGTWSDVARELDSFTTRNSGSQGDKAEYFKNLGLQLREFAARQGIELPQGDMGGKIPDVLTHGDEVHATMPDGTEVQGHVIGADKEGNSVIIQKTGETVTLPEKLTEEKSHANPKSKTVEVLRNPPPGPVEEVAGGKPSEIQQPAPARTAESAGLPTQKTAGVPQAGSGDVAPEVEFVDSTGLTSMQKGKLKKTLSTTVSKRNSQKTYTGSRAKVVSEMVNDGYEPKTEQVNAVPDLSRRQFNNMDGRQQEAFAKRQAEAGKKTEYRLEHPSGSFFDVTKAEHDYAKWLSERNQKPVETPVQATAKVAEHIAEVKQAEGARPAKEIKNELVDHLEKAVEDAKDEDEYLKLETVKVQTGTRANAALMMEDKPLSEVKNLTNANGVRFFSQHIQRALEKHAPKIEINIPGDGDFKIFNTKQALTSVLERAKKIQTSSTEPVAISRSGTSKADREWIQKQLEKQPVEPPPAQPAEKLVGMGAAIPEEFKQGQQSPTSIKNATVENERAARGLPPAIQPAKRGFGRVWDEAMAAIDQDPAIQDRLIDELRAKPRALTDFEDALLLHRQIELQNQYGKLTQEMAQAFDDSKEFPNRLADVEELKPRIANVKDQLFDLYEINKHVGTETGRGLNARKMLAYEDYTLAKMELDARAANGGRPLTEEESAQVKALHDKIEKLRKEYDTYTAQAQARISALEAEKALNEIKQEPPVEPHVRIIADKVKKYFDGRAMAAQKRLSGKTFSFEAALPDLIDLGVSTILSGAADFTIWSSKMLQKLDKSIEPYLKTLWDKSQNALDDHLQKGMAPQNVPKVKRALKNVPAATAKEQIVAKLRKRIEAGKKDEITGYVLKLARLLVSEGIKDRDVLIDTIHEHLKEIDPTITRRETMDAISGYGDFKPLSKDAVSKELRDLKGQMQQVAKLEDMQAGQPPLKTGIERRIPSKEESRLIKLVNEAKQKFQIPITDPNTQLKSALDTLKTRMQTRIEELQQKIKDNDFLPRPKREPLKLDTEALRIKANFERAKLEFERALQDYRLKNRKWWEKSADTLVKWRRGFLLSSPVTLAKLTSAAIQRLAITPLEEAVGAGIGKAIPQVAAKAPREGGLNTKAEARALTSVFKQGMKDAAETIRTGTSPLDVLYGQGREGYVRESMSLPRSVIDFFGNLHAMLKAPVKRAEFERAYEKRTEQAIREGIDVTDPMVQTRIAVDSYKDANRSIFLQDNYLATKVKMFFSAQKKKGEQTIAPGAKAWETTGKVLLPIVRVPTNIVAETFTYAFGLGSGSLRLANALRKGFDTLQPQEADLIMRELKKGSLGFAALLYGYFNPTMFGGYYQQGQKRDPNDAKIGSVKVGSVNIPSFLVHNPLLEVFQLGATVRRVADSKIKGETQGLPAGLMAGALGLSDEVPFVREMFGEIPKMFNPRERGAFFGELAKSIFIPQLLQWLANYTDKDQSGNTNPRSPQTPWQHVETGIPGLRKNVPEKKPTQISQ